MQRGEGGLVAILCAAALAGCQTARPGAVSDGTLVLNRDVPLRTEHNLLVRIQGQGQHPNGDKRWCDYKVLFGPYPPGGGNFGEGHYINTEPTWVSAAGYTYAIGWWPPIRTRRLAAVSTSTEYIAQTDPNFDRIFLLSGGSALDIATIPPSGTSTVLSAPNTYMEATGPIGGPYVVTGPLPIPAVGPIRDFVDYVLATKSRVK